MPAGAKNLAATGTGAWLRSDGSAGAQEVLLDRRASARPGQTRTRMAAGAIEKAARNWLDGALGMNATVETRDHTRAAESRLNIDWNRKPEAEDGPGAQPPAGPRKPG